MNEFEGKTWVGLQVEKMHAKVPHGGTPMAEQDRDDKGRFSGPGGGSGGSSGFSKPEHRETHAKAVEHDSHGFQAGQAGDHKKAAEHYRKAAEGYHKVGLTRDAEDAESNAARHEEHLPGGRRNPGLRRGSQDRSHMTDEEKYTPKYATDRIKKNLNPDNTKK